MPYENKDIKEKQKKVQKNKFVFRSDNMDGVQVIYIF